MSWMMAKVESLSGRIRFRVDTAVHFQFLRKGYTNVCFFAYTLCACSVAAFHYVYQGAYRSANKTKMKKTRLHLHNLSRTWRPIRRCTCPAFLPGRQRLEQAAGNSAGLPSSLLSTGNYTTGGLKPHKLVQDIGFPFHAISASE